MCFVDVDLMFAPIGSYVSEFLCLCCFMFSCPCFIDWVLRSIGNAIPAINAL